MCLDNGCSHEKKALSPPRQRLPIFCFAAPDRHVLCNASLLSSARALEARELSLKHSFFSHASNCEDVVIRERGSTPVANGSIVDENQVPWSRGGGTSTCDITRYHCKAPVRG